MEYFDGFTGKIYFAGQGLDEKYMFFWRKNIKADGRHRVNVLENGYFDTVEDAQAALNVYAKRKHLCMLTSLQRKRLRNKAVNHIVDINKMVAAGERG